MAPERRHQNGDSTGLQTAGVARLRAMFSVTWLALALAAAGPMPTASAFELFGFKFFESDDDETAAVPDPLPYSATLTARGADEDLLEELRENSSLIQKQDSPPSGEPGLIARALADQEQLVARLYGHARYGGTVDITIAGRPLAEVLEESSFAHAPGTPVAVAVTVDPGPAFAFGNVSIEASDAGDVPPLNPVTFGLLRGAPARSDAILEAEAAIVETLKKLGRPLATVTDHEIVADHDNRTVDVRIFATVGPTASFGTATVEGAERMERDFIVEQAAIPYGEQYDPEALRRAAKNLRDLGVFSSVRVVEAEALGPDGRLPVTIEVTERKRTVIGGGATWSSVDGVGLETYWRHRNLFGRAEQLSIEASVGRLTNGGFEDLDYDGRIVFTKPGAFGPATSFTATVGAKREKPETYDSRSVYGKLRATKDIDETLKVGGGTEFSYAREDDALGSGNYALFGIFGDVTWDTRDNILDPTEGVRLSAFLEPAYDAETGGLMAFVRGEASAYRALDEAKRFVVAGRVEAGSIFGATTSDIPPSRRYYVGGGGSVRGYSYRNVGPRVQTSSGTAVIGGRSYFETSAELRVKITETFGLVPFVDAGAAYASEIPDFSEPLKIGAGLGLRYYSPIGPLRLDFAVPLAPGPDDPTFAVYLGLSQAF